MPRQLNLRERLAADLTGAIDKAKTLLGSHVIIERHGGLSVDLTIGLSRWRVRAIPTRCRAGAWHVFEIGAHRQPLLVERAATAGKAVGYIACLAIDDAGQIGRMVARHTQSRKVG